MGPLTQDQLQRVNLFEVLSEDAREEGLKVVDIPTEVFIHGTDDQIREYFSEQRSAVKPNVGKQLSFQPVQPEVFRKWFPGLALSRTQCHAPRWRLLCFPNAGNAEDMYTSEGTGSRRWPSPLLDWCRNNAAECLAVQPPGRNLRHTEQPFTSPQALAQALLPVVASQLTHVPYAVIGHSVGAWCAYEFLMLARARGVPMPRAAFLSAMASPDLAEEARPWRRQAELPEERFKEECRSWDVNEVVFSPALWGSYQPLMRADFTLFDSYCFQHQGEQPLPCPITGFWGTRDRKISRKMVQGWRSFTSSSFRLHAIEGHHLWPLERASKEAWLQTIVGELDSIASSS